MVESDALTKTVAKMEPIFLPLGVQLELEKALGYTVSELLTVSDRKKPLSNKTIARAIQYSSNYYVIVTRESLYQFSYSVTFLPRDDPFNLAEKFFFLRLHLCQFVTECGNPQ